MKPIQSNDLELDDLEFLSKLQTRALSKLCVLLPGSNSVCCNMVEEYLHRYVDEHHTFCQPMSLL